MKFKLLFLRGGNPNFCYKNATLLFLLFKMTIFSQPCLISFCGKWCRQRVQYIKTLVTLSRTYHLPRVQSCLQSCTKKEKTSLLALFPFSATIIKQVTYLWYKNDNKNQILKESPEKLSNFSRLKNYTFYKWIFKKKIH